MYEKHLGEFFRWPSFYINVVLSKGTGTNKYFFKYENNNIYE